jgi:mannose-6-phosphate isomerase
MNREVVSGLSTGSSPHSWMAEGTYPFRVDPRLDPKPWGSRGLEQFGFPLPAGISIGEALITAGEARALADFGGETQLDALVAADPVAIIGRRGLRATANRPLFPLLVKLIDAAENLSIQVHPDDTVASTVGRMGKTEAWHILAAAPDAVLYLGLRADVSIAEFAARCHRGGETAGLLRQIPAVPGTTVLIPAGTVHALGAGVLVYEVQQPSDLTYRLDDWGRVDAAGRSRELHIDLGLSVIDAAARPKVIPPVALGPGHRRQLLAACRYFALEQLNLVSGEEETLELAAPESAQVVTCLTGELRVTTNNADVALAAGETVVIPAACPSARVRALAQAMLLRTWVPDLEAEIVLPARMSQATEPAISALAGGLSDLGTVTAGAQVGG